MLWSHILLPGIGSNCMKGTQQDTLACMLHATDEQQAFDLYKNSLSPEQFWKCRFFLFAINLIN